MRPVVTITANTTLDLTLVISSFQPGKTIRAAESVISIGGKPSDVSYVLAQMGQPSLALGFAAGAFGQRVRQILEEAGVQTDFVEVEGESRINVLIATADDRQQTTITTNTLRVQPSHIAQMEARLAQALPQAACVMLGGTLPTGMAPSQYAAWIRQCRTAGVPVLFDADEPNLSAGLEAAPDCIKPNRDELSRLTGRSIETLDDAYQAARAIFERCGTSVIVTLGGDGALAVLPEGAWRIPPLNVPVVSAGGAGDAVVAGVAEAIQRGEPPLMGLRRGFAYAGAVVQKAGTAQLDAAEARRLIPLVELIPYPRSS